LKGTPIKSYKPDHLYVVEFWATWCGPCIASMPHLSEFAKKNAKNATVIGVDIWEDAHGDTGKAYSTFLPKVSKFVKNMGDKMAYNVIMDNNDQYMGNEWMRAAGQSGIPCSFIIKNDIILWIGHPIDLDSVVNIVNSKDYDVVAARKAQEEKEAESDAAMKPFKDTYAAYEAAVKQKDFDKAIQILDSGIAHFPDMKNTLSFFKFQTLLENVSEAEAMKFCRQWRSAENPQYTGSTGAVICRRPGLSKDTYLYGIELLKGLAETPNSVPATMYNEIAIGYANMGDMAEAVKTQQHAIDLAKQNLKDGKFAGFVTEDVVKEFEASLAKYKNQTK
jgi:thiol-disulfide isomerase/thioredoxin